jgi:hypothetical protein
MIKWLLEKYEDWKFERDFQRKKNQLIKTDPFVYNFEVRDDKKQDKDQS